MRTFQLLELFLKAVTLWSKLNIIRSKCKVQRQASVCLTLEATILASICHPRKELASKRKRSRQESYLTRSFEEVLVVVVVTSHKSIRHCN